MFTKDILLNNLRVPSKKDSELTLKIYSINYWTVDECFKFISNNKDISTDDAITLFIKKMDEYSCKAKTENSSFMFSTAKNMAEDILDSWIIYTMPRKEKQKWQAKLMTIV